MAGAPWGNDKEAALKIYAEIEELTKAYRRKDITKSAYDAAMARLQAKLEALAD